jgi:hypothetical protein
MRLRYRNDAANLLECGNALKDKNFSKATFRALLIAAALIVVLSIAASLFFTNR